MKSHFAAVDSGYYFGISIGHFRRRSIAFTARVFVVGGERSCVGRVRPAEPALRCFHSQLVGCSFPSDYFGNRAVEYNREAEDATLSAMLLNIVRASQRRPMQFTGLQSVTGTSSTSGAIGGSEHNAHNTPYVNSSTSSRSRVPWSPACITGVGNAPASISGGPTFTVPVLDTQEFYQGILTPIPLSVIDFYHSGGIPARIARRSFHSEHRGDADRRRRRLPAIYLQK